MLTKCVWLAFKASPIWSMVRYGQKLNIQWHNSFPRPSHDSYFAIGGNPSAFQNPKGTAKKVQKRFLHVFVGKQKNGIFKQKCIVTIQKTETQ